MACPSRIPGSPLTANQRDHLLALANAEAFSASSAQPAVALDAKPFVSTVVLGALRDKGLAGKRTVTRAHRRLVTYHLTQAGREAITRLQAEAAAR